MKLCKDCKHYVYAGESRQMWAPSATPMACDLERSVVDGRPIGTPVMLRSRGFVTYDGISCGPDADKFEPRPPPPVHEPRIDLEELGSHHPGSWVRVKDTAEVDPWWKRILNMFER